MVSPIASNGEVLECVAPEIPERMRASYQPEIMYSDPRWNEREHDWRNGPIVYQIIVDRFVPPTATNLEQKKSQYTSPRSLRGWDELPKKGEKIEGMPIYAHEMEFWGGDIKSLQSRLSYLKSIGVNVIYLNPIFVAPTNHKYDTYDYTRIDPAYGSREDLASLVGAAHLMGMRVMLDGVFNHVGMFNPTFQAALADNNSPNRDFFFFTSQSFLGYVGWRDIENLPLHNLANQNLQDFLFRRIDSVVQSYIRREGIDGWRLDVAGEMSKPFLHGLTEAVHSASPEAVTIGEVWNYPQGWGATTDGIYNMHARSLIIGMLKGEVTPEMASSSFAALLEDMGIEFMLKSWLVLDNHDNPRIRKLFPKQWQEDMARLLQFTLPGAPVIYYGSELGMTYANPPPGTMGDDPYQRAPMHWDLVTPENPTLAFIQRLIGVREKSPALKYGDLVPVKTKQVFAFMRRTERVGETRVIVVNPTDKPVKETIQLRDGKFAAYTTLKDMLSDKSFEERLGLLEITLPPHGMVILVPDVKPFPNGYDGYRNVE